MKYLLFIFCLVTACSSSPAFAQQTPLNHTVYYLHGRIYTNDREHPWAAALAVRDGKLLCVGTLAHILLDCGGSDEGAEVVQLHGAFLMAGFNDAHVHLGAAGRAVRPRGPVRIAAGAGQRSACRLPDAAAHP